MEELCTQADRFLEARSKTLKTDTNTGVDDHRGREKESGPDLRQQRECYNCNRLGHIRSECKMEGGGKEQRCMNCKLYGHLFEMCRNTKVVAGMIQTGIRIATSARSRINRRHVKTQGSLKTVTGRIGNKVVNVLRDTGCNTLCVDKKFVANNQMTGEYVRCKLVDGTAKMIQTAIVDLDTAYLRQKGATVLCLENPVCDLVIGNVIGALCQCNPRQGWSIETSMAKYKDELQC